MSCAGLAIAFVGKFALFMFLALLLIEFVKTFINVLKVLFAMDVDKKWVRSNKKGIIIIIILFPITLCPFTTQ